MGTSRYLRMAAAAVSVLALAAAGTHQASATDPGDGDPTYGSDEPVLRVDHIGGFVTATTLVTRLPLLVVYGDGRVLTQGPQILIYPGPALPNLQLQRISPAGVQVLVELALAAGVGAELDTGDHPADGPATRLAVRTPAGDRVTVVHEFDPGAGLPDGELRAAMGQLLADLTDLPSTLGADAVSPEQPYQPTVLAAVPEPYALAAPPQTGGGPGEPPELAWPGPPLPGEVLDARLDLHCVTATGDELAEVLAAAQQANALTPWTSNRQRWLVSLRPLLPHETGCADLRWQPSATG